MSGLVTIEEGLDALVEQLPEETRELLARGPLPDYGKPHGCRVCSAMDATIDLDDCHQVDLANLLLDWHDVDGSVGPECYRRCCVIYQAAGWTGEESHP